MNEVAAIVDFAMRNGCEEKHAAGDGLGSRIPDDDKG